MRLLVRRANYDAYFNNDHDCNYDNHANAGAVDRAADAHHDTDHNRNEHDANDNINPYHDRNVHVAHNNRHDQLDNDAHIDDGHHNTDNHANLDVHPPH